MTSPATDLRLTPEIVQQAAHKAVTAYVNGLNCHDTEEVKASLRVLHWMAAEALDLVINGKAEKLS